MLFVALITAFGFMFAHRISQELIARLLFTKSELTKIGTILFSCTLILISVMPRSRFSVWIAIISPLVIAGIALSVAVYRRSLRFRAQFLELLSIVLLKMKSGRSFRQSLLEASNEGEPAMRAKLSQIVSSVAFSQQKQKYSADPFIIEVIHEFSYADQHPHSAMRRVTVFRDKLRIEADFRRRSGQVLSRIRAQAAVMCGLYVAVFAFMICKFGWRTNADLVIASFLLFAGGAIWIWFSGRKMRWKV